MGVAPSGSRSGRGQGVRSRFGGVLLRLALRGLAFGVERLAVGLGVEHGVAQVIGRVVDVLALREHVVLDLGRVEPGEEVRIAGDLLEGRLDRLDACAVVRSGCVDLLDPQGMSQAAVREVLGVVREATHEHEAFGLEGLDEVAHGLQLRVARDVGLGGLGFEACDQGLGFGDALFGGLEGLTGHGVYSFRVGVRCG